MRKLTEPSAGKPFTAAKNVDVTSTVEILRYFAGWADKIHGKVIEVRSSVPTCSISGQALILHIRLTKTNSVILVMNLTVLSCVDASSPLTHVLTSFAGPNHSLELPNGNLVSHYQFEVTLISAVDGRVETWPCTCYRKHGSSEGDRLSYA